MSFPDFMFREENRIPYESEIQSATEADSKCQNGTLELSLEELAIINVLKAYPSTTQKQIAEMTGKERSNELLFTG